MKFFLIIFSVLYFSHSYSIGPDERKKLLDDSIQRLKGSSIEKKVPQLNQQFPDVKLAGTLMSTRLKAGPMLIVVYRGGWCPILCEAA